VHELRNLGLEVVCRDTRHARAGADQQDGSERRGGLSIRSILSRSVRARLVPDLALDLRYLKYAILVAEHGVSCRARTRIRSALTGVYPD
jgi:hypothetical protein